MSLNKLFDVVERARETAQWQAAFGEPQVVGDNTIIPVSRVGYGFGLGFGHELEPFEEEDSPASEAEGGGAGGGAMATPLGAIVVAPEGVRFEETIDAGRISVAGMLLAGFIIYQLAKTVTAIFGRK